MMSLAWLIQELTLKSVIDLSRRNLALLHRVSNTVKFGRSCMKIVYCKHEAATKGFEEYSDLAPIPIESY